MNNRLPNVAGTFYPRKKEELKNLVEALLDQAVVSPELTNFPEKKLRALIVPHAGYVYSGVIAAAGFNLVRKYYGNRKLRVLLLGPSHHLSFSGLATCSATNWSTPLGEVAVDPLNEVLTSRHSETVAFIDAAHHPEHCLEVELPFLQSVLQSFSILPMLTGEGDPAIFAQTLQPYLEQIDLTLVSSDLSHYYPYSRAQELDTIANQTIPALQIEQTIREVEACGKAGVLTLMHLARANGWQGSLVDYRNSGDTAGSKDAVVGYGCYAFFKK